MQSLMQKIFQWGALWIAFTIGCGAQQPGEFLPDPDLTTRPIEMPSPPILEAEALLENNTLTIKGLVRREGNITDISGVTVNFKNASTNQQEQMIVDATGSFDISLTVGEGTLIIGKAIDPKTQQTSNVVKTVIPVEADVPPPSTPQGIEEDTTPPAPSPPSQQRLAFEDAFLSDYDGDGVSDAEDDCPQDPNGFSDSKGDGTCIE